MAERKTDIDGILNHLKEYINILKINNFPIESAYLIGSYAKDSYDEWSDIDVVLVSKCFAGIRLFDKDKIRRLTLDFDSNISPLPYNPDDFNSNDLFVREIKNSGIAII